MVKIPREKGDKMEEDQEGNWAKPKGKKRIKGKGKSEDDMDIDWVTGPKYWGFGRQATAN